MAEKINNISQIMRSTEEYSDVCYMCKDEILIYPIINGRTEYTQEEVEQITLKRIINKLKREEQECHKYKQALDEIKEIANKQRKFDLTGKTPLISVISEVGRDFIDILNIINKVKE